VIPARKSVLRREVEGRIAEQNPELVPGGIISKGDLFIRIDPEDYKRQVGERQAEVESEETKSEKSLAR
jgi:multidrug resistance efflux pump